MRKGVLSEIISKAEYSDDPELYTVGYRDKEDIKETNLSEFLHLSSHFEEIPVWRIEWIEKQGIRIYSKTR